MNNKWQNAVRNMEQRMESLRLNMHGYQILYRGELIGERYWEPFHRDSLHRMYSITKSFTLLSAVEMQMSSPRFLFGSGSISQPR